MDLPLPYLPAEDDSDTVPSIEAMVSGQDGNNIRYQDPAAYFQYIPLTPKNVALICFRDVYVRLLAEQHFAHLIVPHVKRVSYATGKQDEDHAVNYRVPSCPYLDEYWAPSSRLLGRLSECETHHYVFIIADAAYSEREHNWTQTCLVPPQLKADVFWNGDFIFSVLPRLNVAAATLGLPKTVDTQEEDEGSSIPWEEQGKTQQKLSLTKNQKLKIKQCLLSTARRFLGRWTPPPSYPAFTNEVDGPLNLERQRAVHLVVDSPHPAVLLWGRPGTDKTSTVAAAITAYLAQYPSSTILAIAPSNSAADAIALTLLLEFPDVGFPTSSLVRLYANSYSGKREPAIEAASIGMTINALLGFPMEIDLPDEAAMLSTTPVSVEERSVIVCTVNAAIIRAQVLSYHLKQFDLVVLDEAGRCGIAESIVDMMLGRRHVIWRSSPDGSVSPVRIKVVESKILLVVLSAAVPDQSSGGA